MASSGTHGATRVPRSFGDDSAMNTPQRRFEGSGVVVTGAAQGMGLGISELFLAEGAGVIGFDRNEEKLLAESSRLGDRFVPFVGDVSVHDDCTAAVRACIERFDAIDVMCAHTGVADPVPLLEMTDEHWRRHLAVNVDGVMFCTVEAARAMVDGGRSGAIVCTASINAWFVEETMAAYNVTKAAVWTFVRSAAIDLARHGIRVNGVAPGVVDTPLAKFVVQNPVLAPDYLKSIPLERFALPRDVANCVLFLASEEAAYITGQTIVIDGGQTLGIRVDLEQAVEETGGDDG
jgi:NAD(P)-dependent dehydrogenase (short-subunit alcohol dehydrogenase family)